MGRTKTSERNMGYTVPSNSNTEYARFKMVENPNHASTSEDAKAMRKLFKNQVMPIVEKILERTLKVIPSTDTDTYNIHSECGNDEADGSFEASMKG